MPSPERVQQVRAARIAQGVHEPDVAQLAALLEPIWANYRDQPAVGNGPQGE